MKKIAEKLAGQLKKYPRQAHPDEAHLSWLSSLLDTYHIYDTALGIELEAEEKRRGRAVACRQGCTGCCLRPTAPVTELELMGIWWYAVGFPEADNKKKVQARLLGRRQSAECPFLLEGSCSIYAMRPLACRILHVFGRPCRPDEIPVETRPADIWVPSRDVGRKAVMPLLGYFGFSTTQQKEKAFNEGFIPAHSLAMNELDWAPLAQALQESDNRA